VKSKTRNTLIAGVALFIFGPILGWVVFIAGIFKAEQSIAQTPPGTLPNIGQTFSHLFFNLLPVLVGVLLGAVGAFLILFALITHFFRSKE
jgi:hypothetical protein